MQVTKVNGLTFTPQPEIHEHVKKVTGLPSDKKARVAKIQSLRNSVKRLTERQGDVYVAKSDAGLEAVKAAIPIVREGRKSAFKADDIFA